MADFKALPWEPTKLRTGLKANRERRQTEPIFATDRLDQKQGKSLAVAHKKENNQLLKIKQSLENRKHLQEHKINQEEKKLKKLLLKPPRDRQLDNLPSVPFLLKNALKSLKIPPDDVPEIKESDIPKIYSNYLNNMKDTNKKLMGDTEEPEVVISATPRIGIPHRNSIDTTPNLFMQDVYSSSRKGLNTKLAEPSVTFQGYERKRKSLVERTPSIKPEITTPMLKPHEVLSCRMETLSAAEIRPGWVSAAF
ncbi:uncharacterized protein C16orf78 homolog isoform X2 [Macrotis lagotis]|uniref:uncharacterized protein C16orf78 homolog isoform X2 n=1 Tax=Macrotis lagotis TaxID=92651 RepID=UPI003D69673E